jgi:hypothetical protein
MPLPRISVTTTLTQEQVERLDQLCEKNGDISRYLMLKSALAQVDNPEHPDQSIFLTGESA